jgi:hypothetical protein
MFKVQQEGPGAFRGTLSTLAKQVCVHHLVLA